jgi:activating signal cointegrator 1
MNLEVKKKKKKKGEEDEEEIEEKLTSKGNLLSKGRNNCDCEGVMHEVLTNCLNCGHIVCEQEGYGDCFFCSNFVQNPKDSTSNDILLSKAVEQKNKLLEFDKNFTKRQIIYDDQTDYYESDVNQWLSEEEKKERKSKEDRLKKLKEEKKNTFKIDFAGRKIVEDNSATQEEIQKVLKDLRTSSSTKTIIPNPTVSKLTFPKNYLKSTSSISGGEEVEMNRLQNDYFDFQLEEFPTDDTDVDPSLYDNPSTNNFDQGKCLSMHQPWASLLVQGIKRHEGRFWDTQYRGRLWIASTVQEPSEEEIKTVEEQYIKMGRTNFPKFYPKSALLGCVDLVDVLSQEDYQNKIKEDEKESESEFVFIVKNPRKMIVPFSISGQPYIWKLDNEDLQTAQSGLKPIPKK